MCQRYFRVETKFAEDSAVRVRCMSSISSKALQTKLYLIKCHQLATLPS